MLSHTFKHLRDELRFVLIRFRGSRVRRRYKNSDNILVNIGSGTHGKAGWVNLDVSGLWPVPITEKASLLCALPLR